jgi:2-methylcitrate dehydratase PrpD
VLDASGGYRAHNHADGWHSTGTCGSFAAAAAVSKALGLDVREITWALGLAGSFTGGTWAFTRDGAMSKRYHAGRAAETGVTAACLARSGFTGPAAIFEAPWGGFLGTYARAAPAPDVLVRDLGARYGIMRSGIKPYAACRDIHSSLDVILQARRVHDLGPDDIARIAVRCIPEMIQMVGQVTNPGTRLEAQLSLPYSIAVALVTGRASVAEYESPFRDDPAVQRLARKVVLRADPDLPPDSEPHLVITTTDGRRIPGHVAYASGAPQNPLPPEAIVRKFETLAARVLPSRQVQALKEDVLALETLPDARRITRHLRTR